MMTYYYCSECDNTVTFGHECPAVITPSDMGKAFNEYLKEQPDAKTSYMNPAGYVDPASKYYIDRMWEEYHKIKEELADTKSKLGQLEDYISETLKPELADAKLKLKMAHSAWDELDKSHAERAKLHDMLIIAEGQRDQANMRAEKAERLVFEERTNRAFAVRAVEAERDELQLQVGDWKDVAEQFRDALVERGKVLGFFASVIKSGEPWTPQCDEMLRATFVHKDTAPAAQPSTDTWEDTRARCS